MRLGIYGGSFDPVHNGHLAMARACQAGAALDEVWFMPTAIQPLKRHGAHATNAERVEMLNLAIESEKMADDEPRGSSHRSSWRTCSLEIDRGGVSYTVDTLRQLREELPEAALFFMFGADAVREVPMWKEPVEIFRRATPLVVRRAGQAPPDLTALARLCTADHQPIEIAMPPVDVSSSEIRRRVDAGESIANMVPPLVEPYIAANGLYR